MDYLEVGSRRQELGEDQIEYDNSLNLLEVAFTSPQFQARVNKGLQRVSRLKAESAFTVYTNGKSILYSSLVLGSPLIGHDNPEDSVGLFAGGASTPSTPQFSAERLVFGGLESFFMLGAFHYHPDFSPFSNQDIETRDELSSLNSADRESPYEFWDGVFMPRWEWDEKSQKYKVSALKLFMYGERPTSNAYQAADFHRMTLDEQRRVLEESGFRILLIDLPINKRIVDLTPLKTAFTQ